MTIPYIFRPTRRQVDVASLTLTLYLGIAVSVTAYAQGIGPPATIGNARQIQPPTGLPQTGMPMTATGVRIAPADPADMLSMHLRTLSVAPRSLSALLGAGESALAVGDPNAALGFYARAEQVDPRSGKAKAGLASALVMLERADDALPLFAQAVSLGTPEAEIASSRGLAYDLRGDSRRAQRDYQLALRRAPDDETTRRYALSLGISGDRAQAMAMLDPLLRKQDQSAWRARAFILAMTGDVAGANGIARQVMPANLAATMSPFLTRLPQLNPADKAHAVAFGTMPSSGRNMASVEIGDPFHAITGGGASDGLIPAGQALGSRPDAAQVARAAVPLSREPRRRPGREVLTLAAPPATAPVAAAPGVTGYTGGAARTAAVPGRVSVGAVTSGVTARQVLPAPGFSAPPLGYPQAASGTQIATAGPMALPPAVTGFVAKAPAGSTTREGTVAETRAETKPLFETTPTPAPTPTASAQVQPENRPAFETAPAYARAPFTGPPAAISAPAAITAPASTLAPTAAPVSTPVRTPVPVVGQTPTAPFVTKPAPATVTVARPVSAVPMSRLASILAGLTPEMESSPVALPTPAEAKAARRLAQRKAAEAAAVAADLKAEKEAKAAAAAEARRNPARLWVQVATGSNERGLPTTWNRIRNNNETALQGRSAYSLPFKATNRLLVGPMKSPADARSLVNTLAKNGLSANIFNSEAGQEVNRVDTQ